MRAVGDVGGRATLGRAPALGERVPVAAQVAAEHVHLDVRVDRPHGCQLQDGLRREHLAYAPPREICQVASGIPVSAPPRLNTPNAAGSVIPLTMPTWR